MSRRRAANPITGGVIAQGVELGISGIAVGLAQPFIHSLVGRFIGASPIANAGLTLATAYGLSWLAGMTNVTKRYARSVELAGWTLAATQLATTYALPLLRVGAPSNGMSGPYRRRGMSGIAAVHGIPPVITPPPLPPAPANANGNGNASSGMSGMASIPGRFAR